MADKPPSANEYTRPEHGIPQTTAKVSCAAEPTVHVMDSVLPILATLFLREEPENGKLSRCQSTVLVQ